MKTQEQQTILIPSKKKVKLLIFSAFLAVISFLFYSCDSSTPSIKTVPYKSGDMWGYIDKEGKILINPQFAEATVFIDGIALVRSADNKYGYIGEDGKYIINPTYKSALPFSEGIACVVPENGKPQFIDEKNNVKFTVNTGEYCGSFNEGLAPVKIEDKWCFIDKEGNIKINAQFDYVRLFSEGFAAVSTTNKEKGETLWGFVNKKGEITINYQFKYVGRFNDGLAVVSDGEKYGYIDKSGKYVINPQFEAAGDFKNGMAIISQGSMYGYIDKEGKIIINPQFKNALNFSDDNDIALVWSSDGKAGYIDKDGKYLINPQFEKGTNFYGDVAFVRSADKWGIIDKDGKYLVNPQFDKIDVDFERFKYQTVESDYFDMAGIIQKFLGNTDQNNFRGINEKTTFTEIANSIGGKEKLSIHEYNNNATYYPEEELSKDVKLNKIEYYFDNLIAEQKPVYKTVQKYDYWKGNYNVQELDYYENIFNNNAKITSASYSFSFSGKANEKKQDLMKALSDEISMKLGLTNNSANTSFITLNNNDFSITINKNEGVLTVVINNQLMSDMGSPMIQQDIEYKKKIEDSLVNALNNAFDQMNQALDKVSTTVAE